MSKFSKAIILLLTIGLYSQATNSIHLQHDLLAKYCHTLLQGIHEILQNKENQQRPGHTVGYIII